MSEPPLVSEEPTPDAGAGPPRRGVTLLQKVLIGVGLAALVITGAIVTALNSPGRYSDAEACAEAQPLIMEAAETEPVAARHDKLLADVGRFEAAQRRAVPDGKVAAALADTVATMHDDQRTNDPALYFKLILNLTSVTAACAELK